MEGTDLTILYNLREDFTIIAITGRIGSGCGIIAKQLEKGFNDGENFPDSAKFPPDHNSYRKYRIIYNYAKQNFTPFKRISYKDILTLFILKHGFDEFIKYLSSVSLTQSFQKSKLQAVAEFTQEIAQLNSLKDEFEILRNKYLNIDFKNLKQKKNQIALNELFFGDTFNKFSSDFHKVLRTRSRVKGIKTLQIISNNLRKSGHPYNINITDPNNIFIIARLINDVIKAYKNRSGKTSTKIVIDSLRNPLEIMFFKQRFAAFYLFVVSQEDPKRKKTLIDRYGKEFDDIWIIAEEEYKRPGGNEFYKPFVRECIEKADIHISFKTEEEAQYLNREQKKNPDNTSPYYSWGMQLLKYITLINHPGLVTPSPEERCMQLAITAKYNSGCISRQVGAAVTDEYYSIKSIGWNNTPEGQVPCNLRSAEDLMNHIENKSGDGDLAAFTPFEKNDKQFRETFVDAFRLPVIQNRDKLNGRNVCFCFKTLINSFSEGKNQVHTRSLHAEESAFLQITKYGGTGVKNGKLFTTASPCELCSKKAYQLGIRVIYYIDPYPGISDEQILQAGTNPPVVRLFNGAIGNAYNWLYDPLMNYKDEQSIILGQNIQDLASRQKIVISQQKERITELEGQLQDFIANKQ